MTRPAAQPEQKSQVGDWVKWACGLAWTALAVLIPYVVNLEHRLTSTETTLAEHKTASAKAETEIRAAVAHQDESSQKILAALTDVQTGVAKINGYLEARKSPQN